MSFIAQEKKQTKRISAIVQFFTATLRNHNAYFDMYAPFVGLKDRNTCMKVFRGYEFRLIKDKHLKIWEGIIAKIKKDEKKIGARVATPVPDNTAVAGKKA